MITSIAFNAIAHPTGCPPAVNPCGNSSAFSDTEVNSSANFFIYNDRSHWEVTSS